MAIAYLRVSTTEQADSGLGLEAQELAIRSYCQAKGLVIDEFVVDRGHSGATLHRPGLTGVLDRVRAGGVDTVVVAKLDRLSRRVIDTLNTIELLRRHGTDIIFVQEAIDSTTAIGKAMLALVAVFAQMERDLVSERTTAALAAKRARGEALANPAYGTLQGEREAITLASALREEGYSLRQIGTVLSNKGLPPRRSSQWSPEMVRRLIMRGASLSAVSS